MQARLADREMYLLWVLGRRRYLDAEQLTALFYPDRDPSTYRREVERLRDLGVVDSSDRYTGLWRTVQAGPKPFVYWLTPDGCRLVEGRFGEEIKSPPGRKRGETYDPGVEHTLTTNALWVAAVLDWRSGGSIVNLTWKDEWRGGLLKLPMATAEAPRKGKKPSQIHFRPDAYLQMLLATEGQRSAVVPVYKPTQGGHQTIADWATMFPDLAQPQTAGVSKVAPIAAFVETDLGKARETDLFAKMEKYRYVRRMPQYWADHYNVPRLGPQKTALWPGLMVLALTERRMRTLGKIFKDCYEGWVLLACFDWDVDRLGLVRGPVWWDPQGDVERLPLVEALRGLRQQAGK